MSSQRRDPKLRASDADRDEVAEQLREHFATGRLSMDELNERLDKVYAAQTYGDLEPLVEDLPGPGPYSDLPVPFPSTGQRGPDGLTARFEHGWSGLQHRNADWATWASASAVCWGIWLATFLSGGSASGFWPVWVMLPWGGLLLAASFTGDKQRELEQPRRPALPPGPADHARQGRGGRRAERLARRNDRVRRRLE
jgi:Domain of unknown function (DUF1707)